MKKLLLPVWIILFLSGCGISIKPVEVEAGTDIADLTETVTASIEKEVVLNLDTVDLNSVGEYEGTATYHNKDYTFKVIVADTVTPTAELKEAYTITQPGTLTAADCVENIIDATSTSVGFLSFEKRADLSVMTEETMESNALTSSETLLFSEEMNFKESLEAADDGIYDSQIAVRDEAGNMLVFDYTFYVDGTGPEFIGLEDMELEIDTEDWSLEIPMTGKYAEDNLDGAIEWQAFTEPEIEILDEGDGTYLIAEVKNTVADRAGNITEGAFQLTVRNTYYEALYADMLGELEKLFAQNSSSSGNQTSAGSTADSAKDAQARAVAQAIAEQCTAGTDLERVRRAAQIVAGYCANAVYTTSDPDYRTAYGVFCKGVYTCAGSTRAMGMVLECMGFSWSHANENQWSHQWCIVHMDGQAGWADGMGGIADYGTCPFTTGDSYIAPDGTIYTPAS